jgi:hypothetical protein
MMGPDVASRAGSCTWTIKEDIEALIRGADAEEIISHFREFVAAADDLALRCEERGEHPPQVERYWKARYREMPG